MPEQTAAQRRCATCDRWQGPRRAGAAGDAVIIETETVTGLCNGGPWDGQERRARSACGKWTVWRLIQPADGG